jgi:hypothetical protein
MPLITFDDGVDAVADQVTQFYDLLTGSMTDQTVTLKNTLTVGGNQATNAHLLTLIGVGSQTGDFLRVIPSGASTPTFAIDSDGKMTYSQEAVLENIGTPTAPSSGTALYSKTGGLLYVLPADGEEDTLVQENATQELSNKTLVQPVISDFTNAPHDHADEAGGGTLTIGSARMALQNTIWNHVTIDADDSPYTVPDWGYHVDVDASGGPVTVVLPTAVGKAGSLIEVRKSDDSANAVTVTPNGSETINRAASWEVEDQDDSWSLRSDNVNVVVV